MAKKSSTKKKTARKTPARPAKKAARSSGSSDPDEPKDAGESNEPLKANAAIDPPDPEGFQPADLSALKEGKLYYRIGEVSQITGVKPYVLRYWESEFRLMSPQKSRSKQRLYRQKDIETILAIKRLLYEERYTIAGARRRLRELGAGARAQLATEEAEGAAAEASARKQYRRIRDELLAIRSLLAAEI